MADVKISELNGATTPLGGTEVVPIVQNGETKKVAVSEIGGGANPTSGILPVNENGVFVDSVVSENSGNIGIGTINPSAFDAGAERLVVGNGTDYQGMTIYTGTTHEGSIHFADGTGTGIANRQGQIKYSHSDNSMRFGTSSSEKMRIDSSGNVGIGTTSPLRKLDVSGSIAISKNAEFLYGKTSSGGNVRLLGINSGNTAYIGAIDSGVTSTIFNASSTSNTATFYTAGSEKMRIDSSGNVGIGTTSPSEKLDVRGNIQFGDGSGIDLLTTNSGNYLARYNNSTSEFALMNTSIEQSSAARFIKFTPGSFNTLMYLDGVNDRVGIGTTSPTETLDVIGTVKAQGYKSSDGSAGITQNVNTGGGNTLVIKNGIITQVI